MCLECEIGTSERHPEHLDHIQRFLAMVLKFTAVTVIYLAICAFPPTYSPLFWIPYSTYTFYVMIEIVIQGMTKGEKGTTSRPHQFHTTSASSPITQHSDRPNIIPTTTWTCIGCNSLEITMQYDFKRKNFQAPASFKYYCLCAKNQFVCRTCYETRIGRLYCTKWFGPGHIVQDADGSDDERFTRLPQAMISCQ